MTVCFFVCFVFLVLVLQDGGRAASVPEVTSQRGTPGAGATAGGQTDGADTALKPQSKNMCTEV